VRYDEPLSLILIDLDGFKLVNDTLGYEAGDAVLQEFAEILRQEIRETDAAFRYKVGDEFAIILPNTALWAARVPAERLRGRVEHYRFTFPRVIDPISLTMCAGVVSLRTSRHSVKDVSREERRTGGFSSLIAERLQARAEKALAKAKRTKNSVIAEESAGEVTRGQKSSVATAGAGSPEAG
jgi:diguanylate cyclase (GGDEF)-like protein